MTSTNMSLGAIQLNKIEYLLINAVELKIFCNEDVLKFVPIESYWLLSGNLSSSLLTGNETLIMCHLKHILAAVQYSLIF